MATATKSQRISLGIDALHGPGPPHQLVKRELSQIRENTSLSPAAQSESSSNPIDTAFSYFDLPKRDRRNSESSSSNPSLLVDKSSPKNSKSRHVRKTSSNRHISVHFDLGIDTENDHKVGSSPADFLSDAIIKHLTSSNLSCSVHEYVRTMIEEDPMGEDVLTNLRLYAFLDTYFNPYVVANVAKYRQNLAIDYYHGPARAIALDLLETVAARWATSHKSHHQRNGSFSSGYSGSSDRCSTCPGSPLHSPTLTTIHDPDSPLSQFDSLSIGQVVHTKVDVPKSAPRGLSNGSRGRGRGSLGRVFVLRAAPTASTPQRQFIRVAPFTRTTSSETMHNRRLSTIWPSLESFVEKARNLPCPRYDPNEDVSLIRNASARQRLLFHGCRASSFPTFDGKNGLQIPWRPTDFTTDTAFYTTNSMIAACNVTVSSTVALSLYGRIDKNPITVFVFTVDAGVLNGDMPLPGEESTFKHEWFPTDSRDWAEACAFNQGQKTLIPERDGVDLRIGPIRMFNNSGQVSSVCPDAGLQTIQIAGISKRFNAYLVANCSHIFQESII